MIRQIFLILVFCLSLIAPSHAAWVWTPESGKFINPKNAVKETPKDQLAFAVDLYTAKDYKKATDEFQKLLKT